MKPPVLAVVSHFTWLHIPYLRALAHHFDVAVAVAGESDYGAVAHAKQSGLSVRSIGTPGQVKDAALRELIDGHSSRLIHLMYSLHEELVLLVRRTAPPAVKLVYECRDPRSTLLIGGALRRSDFLERNALRAVDGHIFVSNALRDYLAARHGMDLSAALIVPNGFAEDSVGGPTEKLSARDGRVHICLGGTASDEADHERNYLEIIRRLVGMGFVVHSHFFKDGENLKVYERLAEELSDYHCHPAVDQLRGTALSETVSRYDIMGVFYERSASRNNDFSATFRVCMPTKAVCGWLLGGIPIVCFAQYRGLVEQIDALGIGFAVERIDECRRLLGDRKAILRATEACLRHRYRFTNEWNASRIRDYFACLSSPHGAG
jgi:hypothetical protein